MLVVGTRIELKYIRPKIWRRVVLPIFTDLKTLHDIIQVAFNWDGDHMWDFRIKNESFGIPIDPDFFFWREVRYAGDYDLKYLIGRGVKRFTYTYDFGDDWEHDVILGVVRKSKKPIGFPVLVGGARCAPREDTGGEYGYYRLIEASLNPDDEDNAEFLEMHGGKFDPDEFDEESLRAQLEGIRIMR